MNKEIILNNLEVARVYLRKNYTEFAELLGKESSYYRNVIIYKKSLPSLEVIVKLCECCHIKIDRFLNEKLELQLIFESDKYLHSGEIENKEVDNQ